MTLACNIGPHPGHLKTATDRSQTTRDEFLHLVNELHPFVDLFVINLSSPNTPGLRSLLQSPELCERIVLPVRSRVRELDESFHRTWRTPLLVKLPPEDENRELWTEANLKGVVEPLLAADAVDGFVAVNTSARLALQYVSLPPPELPGGISGEPLRAEALRVVSLLRNLIGPEKLLIGCGGVMAPEHAVEFRRAGADLVELYSGMIYAGPGLPALRRGHGKQGRLTSIVVLVPELADAIRSLIGPIAGGGNSIARGADVSVLAGHDRDLHDAGLARFQYPGVNRDGRQLANRSCKLRCPRRNRPDEPGRGSRTFARRAARIGSAFPDRAKHGSARRLPRHDCPCAARPRSVIRRLTSPKCGVCARSPVDSIRPTIFENSV